MQNVIPEDDEPTFEDDMELGNYKTWVDRYPDMIQTIFAELILQISKIKITDQIVKDFISRGLDINKVDSYTKESNTYLEMTIYAFDTVVLDVLLSNGATFDNQIVNKIFTVFLEGMKISDKDLMDMLEIIEKHNIPLFLDKINLYNEKTTYINKGHKGYEYIKEFADKCQYLDKDEVDVEKLFGDVKNAAKITQ